MTPLKWAIVGTSDFALNWVLSALEASDVAEPVAIVSRDPGSARTLHPQISVPFVPDLAIARSFGAEVAHVITPNDTHRDLAVAAANLGMHILVEKPLAPTAADAEAIAAAASRAGVELAVGSCMAWSPVLVAAVEALRDPRFGRLRHIDISAGFDVGDKRGWRQSSLTAKGGGVLMDLGAHAFDAVERLGGPVRAVRGMLRSTLPDHPADDTALVVLEHHSDVTSTVRVAFTHACNDMTVTGDGGRLAGREWLGRRFAGDLRWEHGRLDASTLDPGAQDDERLLTGTIDVIQLQADEVSRAFQLGVTPMHATPEAGRRVVRIIEAAIESNRLGGAAVPVA